MGLQKELGLSSAEGLGSGAGIPLFVLNVKDQYEALSWEQVNRYFDGRLGLARLCSLCG